MKRRWMFYAVLAAALVYPLAVLAGGSPRFPSRAECIHPVREGGQIEAVFGRFDRQDDADAMLHRVLSSGFVGSLIEPDGCGLLKVDVHGVSSLAVGRDLIAEAAKVGLRATLEEAPP